ncbi:threonine ammonia-lyase [Roseibium litorale]|uniref:Threonine/serine dehydratase n=1 Tax=Roseibium litorale TaxID=2803841 RepID=A0ABR9CIA0_9HYPH|nr:threonine/serine dehydratase [Roseibium litorale]MBD8890458.1 threonine/serine dehydratase [Roseibium litorale]
MTLPITYQDIEHARARLHGVAVVTPLLRFPVLDALTGGTVLIKPENLQRTGSFKFRGAYNRLSQIPDADRPNGVVACSSGNHAQGVAEAARLLGMSATIVMPADAPQMKLRRTREYGAQVITYDRDTQDREAIAADLCAESGATFVHPYNDRGIIAGQGTIGAEIAEQAKAMELLPDAVLAGASGGGLTSGIAVALASDLPGALMHTVEPEGFDDLARSLRSGSIEQNTRTSGSVCDALLAKAPGDLTFPILKNLGGEGLQVSDREALAAVAFALNELKLVTEPGGVVGLAAVLSGKISCEGRVICVVLTGGNADLETLLRYS